jgi:segregation and condensation protein B
MAPGLDRTRLKLVIESILFVADGPVDVRTLTRLTESSADDVTAAIDELAFEAQTRGVRYQRTGQAVQLVSAPETAPFVQRYLGIDEHQRLSPTVLATLTVLAYKQPATKGQVERILKKSCDYSIDVLKARELIAEVGRAETPGRPYLYGTTFKFLEHFGLEKPEDLPPLPELETAAQKAEGDDEGDEEGLPTVEELLGDGEEEEVEEGLPTVEELLGPEDERE